MVEKKKIGRPPGTPVYANKEAIKKQLVGWMSEGKTLREFCRKEEMPVYATIYDWLEEDAEFSARFARARDMGHDAIAEDALRIADSIFLGKKVVTHSGGSEDEDTMTVTEEDSVQHRKLQIETRLKLLAKWNPKKYGEKTVIAGDADAPLAVAVDFGIFGELIKNMTLKRQSGE
jgi:hypothetical protein